MATAVTWGVWSNISAPSIPELKGLNTPHISWGVPARGSSGQSGYRFDESTVDVLLDGVDFVLGTFTHDNFPMRQFNPDQFDVDLHVRVNFNDGALEKDFSLPFHHHETPNDSPAPEDLVTLPTVDEPLEVEIDGVDYDVVIRGFLQGGQIVRQFVSPEESSNSADIIAWLKRVPLV